MDDAANGKSSAIQTTTAGYDVESYPSNNPYSTHGPPRVISVENDGLGGDERVGQSTIDAVDDSKKGLFAYFQTKDFYIVLVLGYLPPPSNRYSISLYEALTYSPPVKSSQSALQVPTPSPPSSSPPAPPSPPSKPFSTTSS